MHRWVKAKKRCRARNEYKICLIASLKWYKVSLPANCHGMSIKALEKKCRKNGIDYIRIRNLFALDAFYLNLSWE